MLPLLDASILPLIAVELVPLLCTNFTSAKLFECYYGPLVRCIDTYWCYLKGDINCNYYYRFDIIHADSHSIRPSPPNFFFFLVTDQNFQEMTKKKILFIMIEIIEKDMSIFACKP